MSRLRTEIVDRRSEELCQRQYAAWFGETRVHFSTGKFAAVPSVLAELALSGPTTIISSPSQERLGRVDELSAALAGQFVGAFSCAASHTSLQLIAQASERIPSCETVIAIGGGGAIGLAKALAVQRGIQYIAVPTTFSGSEMTDIYGIAGQSEKRVQRDARARARGVIYDPDLLRTLPVSVARASLVNCLAHCLEATWLADTSPLAITLGEEACRLVGLHVDDVSGDLSGDCGVDLLIAAWLGGVVLASTGVGVHHDLCHIIGGVTAAPHALIHSIVLPQVMCLNNGAELAAQRRLTRHLSGRIGVDDQMPPDVVVRELCRRWSLPESLGEIWPGELDLDFIVRKVNEGQGAARNRIVVGDDVIRSTLMRIVGGS